MGVISYCGQICTGRKSLSPKTKCWAMGKLAQNSTHLSVKSEEPR